MFFKKGIQGVGVNPGKKGRYSSKLTAEKERVGRTHEGRQDFTDRSGGNYRGVPAVCTYSNAAGAASNRMRY